MATAARVRGNILYGSAVAATLIGIAAPPAATQSAPNDGIDAIERQMRTLEGEMQQLKGELDEAKKQLRQSRGEAAQARDELRRARQAAVQANQDAATAVDAQARATQAAAQAQAVASAPAAPAKPQTHVVQTAGNRFGLESADGQNSIYLTGRLHFDVGNYLDFKPGSKFAAAQKLDSGVNARRARLGVTGKFAGDWAYTFIYDFGGSSDGFPPTTGAPASGIQTAMVTYNGFNRGPTPIAFDMGYMDTPFTLDEATSSNDIMFMERASIQNVASNILAYDFRSAVGARSNNDRYWAGVYLTGPMSGATIAAQQAVSRSAVSAGSPTTGALP